MAFIIGNVDDALLPQSVIDALAEDASIYGVRFDGTNSAGVRTYDATNLTWERSSNTVAGVDDFANLAPFNVKECITQYNSDTGERELLAYKGDANWDELVTNKTGDRMVEIPCFWYARPSRYEFIVSPKAKLGFKPSPMHYRKGVLHDKIRITKYHLDNNYSSQTGTSARVNTNTNTFRTNLRAKGLQLLDLPTWYMLIQLMLIKYANMNVQSVVGYGTTGGSGVLSGATDSLLGLDGSPTTVSANESVLTLGIENFFSKVWHVIDGAYLYNNKIYIKDVEDMISDPINYQELQDNYNAVNTEYVVSYGGLVNGIAFDMGYDWMLFPTSVGSPSPTGDGIYSSTGFNLIRMAGGSDSDASGLFACSWNNGVGHIADYGGAFGIEIVPNESTVINPATVSTYNNKYFDTTDGLKLKTQYNIPMSTPTSITDGTTTKYISRSDNIDFGDYKTVEGIEVG